MRLVQNPGQVTPSQQIDAHIQHLNDWRGETLAWVRTLIRQALPDVVETVKWRGVPVSSSAGIICTGETTKSAVKLMRRLRETGSVTPERIGGHRRPVLEPH